MEGKRSNPIKLPQNIGEASGSRILLAHLLETIINKIINIKRVKLWENLLKVLNL